MSISIVGATCARNTAIDIYWSQSFVLPGFGRSCRLQVGTVRVDEEKAPAATDKQTDAEEPKTDA